MNHQVSKTCQDGDSRWRSNEFVSFEGLNYLSRLNRHPTSFMMPCSDMVNDIDYLTPYFNIFEGIEEREFLASQISS